MQKKITAGCLACIIIATLILPGCGKDKQQVQPETKAQEQPKTEQEQPDGNGQGKQQQTALAQVSDPEKGIDEGQGIICVSYESYSNAWNAFSKHINKQSGDHEIVSIHQSTAMPLELKNLNYLLPLSFLGESQTSSGKFDAAFETTLLQVGWAEDAVLTYDGNAEYLLKGTDTQGSKLEIHVRYDDKADSLRLEGYKDGALDLLFEYSMIPGGYAAQYYFEAVTHMDKATPIYGWCTYKLIFLGSNGSCSRFDNVSSEPDSIYGVIPDKQIFIDGATHWFTITDGEFAGTLGGKEF